MNRMQESPLNLVNRLIKDESGATAIEYDQVPLVAVAIIAALTALGGSLDSLFTNVSDTVDAAAGS